MVSSFTAEEIPLHERITMDLRSVQLVVTDMDGTLLNSRHEVSARFMELFHALNDRGIQFVAASGRQHNNIVSKLPSIQDELIFIAENGGLVRKGQEEWLATPLKSGIKNSILDSLNGDPHIYPVLCAKEAAYISDNDHEFMGILREYYSAFETLGDLYEFQEEVMKVAIYHPVDSETHIYPRVKHFEDELMVKVSGKNWVDLSHRDAHKGYALERVQRRLGITASQTLVFGDYNNDIEMMEHAHFSYAMANAHPNVKAAARFETLSNDERGVEHILAQLLQQLS